MQEASEVIKLVKKIEISTKNIVDGLIAGNYQSVFRGNGIEFSEIREYLPGDDVRAIDWNVTARFNRPFVKEFIEERDLHVYFVFDTSASGYFGNNVSKKRKSIELCASLMFSAMRNNDNVGLFLATDKIEKFYPARKGRKHVLKLISNLITYQPKSMKTNLHECFSFVSKVIKRRSIVFLISDFLSDDFYKPLQIMRKKHDVIAIKICDEREKELPNVGYINLEDEETGEQILVDTSDDDFREKYAALVEKHTNELLGKFKKNKIDVIEFNTNETSVKPLKRFFKQRAKRIR